MIYKKPIIYGDPHNRFDKLKAVLKNDDYSAGFMVGDIETYRPFNEVYDDISNGKELYWIHGNHDTKNETVYNNLLNPIQKGCINNKYVDIDGTRISGLGGIFRGHIWYPKNNKKPKYYTREDYLKNIEEEDKYKGGIPLKHNSTIFYEDFEALSKISSDILITHEAPSTHRFGFKVIDELAKSMGVQLIVHGHQHESYKGVTDNKIEVIGLDSREIIDIYGNYIL